MIANLVKKIQEVFGKMLNFFGNFEAKVIKQIKCDCILRKWC